MEFIERFMALLAKLLGWQDTPEVPVEAPKQPPTPVAVPLPPNPLPMNPDALLPWNTTSSLSHENWHNVRALCDLEGLSHEQKEELCATVWGESEFNIHAINRNYAFHKDGMRYVSSIDNGICQWNDYFHSSEITPDQATNDPEKAVRLMCQYWKRGQQNAWCAHSNGSYKQYLGRTL